MTPTAHTLWLIGTLLALTGVAFGAFGGHALNNLVTADRVDTWQTAVRYQMYHALALLALGLLANQSPQLRLIPTAACFALGCLAFSGSLYLLVLSDIRLFGILTPVGGLLFLLGWGLLGWQLLMNGRRTPHDQKP